MMKNVLCVLLMMGGLVGGGFAGDAVAETVRLAQYEVFPLASEHLPEGGFAGRITTEAFARYGHEVSVRWYPLQRVLMMVKTYMADISLGWPKTQALEETVIFSDEPLLHSPMLFFYRKDTAFEWDTLADLSGLRLGYLIGGSALSDAVLAAEASGEFTIDRVPTYEQNLKKLLAGRIDAMIGSPLNIPMLLQSIFSQEEQARIAMHPKPLFDVPYYAIFSKQLSPEMINAFNDGVRQLRESGRFEHLLNEAFQQ